MDNRNENNNQDEVAVLRVVVNLVGGRSLGACPICTQQIILWATPPNTAGVAVEPAVEPTIGCGHHFHRGCLRAWFLQVHGRQPTCPICRVECHGLFYVVE
jgi:hypothetical protein